MKILFIKSIFCPNKSFLNICIKSITNMNLFSSLIDVDVCDLLIIGWIGNFENKFNLFTKFYPFKFSNISYRLWHINYGKYKMLNDMLDFCQNKIYDYIIYSDHDIEFGFSKLNIIKKSLNSINSQTVNNKKIGLIAFNQSEDIRHQRDIYENRVIVDYIEYIYPNKIQSIACGAFYINFNIFLELDHFEIHGVYGLDDFHLMKKLEDNGCTNLVIKDYFIIHPFNILDDYDKWKIKSICSIINNEKYNYYKMIEENHNLW